MKNYDIQKSEEIIFKGEDNFIFQITNTENELEVLKGKSNSSNKFSVIDLGECANYLRNHYKFNENTSFLIIKYEKITNISSERTLQYEVYEPYNKTKLNLSICNNITIDVYVPVILSEKMKNLYEELKEKGYDLFDIESSFYQDICTPYKSENGTDVPLSDRINYYYNNEETACQSNCKFSDYLMESQYLKCDCDISNSEINTKESKKFKPKLIYESFFSVLKYSNYKVLKCSKLAFTIKSFTNNKGSIITIVYFLTFLLCLIINLIKGINQLKKDILNNIIEKSENNIYIKEKDDVRKKNEQKERIDNLSLNNSRNKTKLIKRNIFKYPPKKVNYLFKDKKLYNNNKNNILNMKKGNNILIPKQRGSLNTLNKKNEFKEKIIIINQILNVVGIEQKEKEILDNYELNELEYDSAMKLDKRNFIEIYWPLLKREHSIIFTFITKDDHNITYIKYSRFFFLLSTDMAMNVFFFADETMHKIFLDYGKYNFIQQIPQIIYTTIISQLIEIFLCYLSLTDKYIYQIKNDSKLPEKSNVIKIIRCIKTKLIIFFVFTFIFLGFYWYTIVSFCSVYQNTQITFLKDSLLSFLLGLLYPFVLYLIPAALRILSIRHSKYKLKCIYKLSDIIPFF